MVHALKEAWRVLVPQGIMIDVRPLSIISSLEVVSAIGRDLAGEADMTPDLKYDIAADKAVNQVLEEHHFEPIGLETFDYFYYWKTFHGMVADFRDTWKEELIVTKEVLDKAKYLYQQNYPYARLRMPMRMMLGRYLKI